MLDGTGTTTYSYDDLNRLTGTTHAGASVGYAWDDVSRLTALTYPSGDVVTRAYDDAGQLATVTDWADREFAFDWTDDGQLAQVSYPNGVVTSYERDVAGQVTGLTAASQAGLDLLELAYGYSDAGLMTDRTTTRGTATQSAQFTWDAQARLDAVTGTGAGDVGFDAAGSVTMLPHGRELTYDAGRQVTTLTVPGADDTVVTTGFTYDARGNRLTATTDTGPNAGTVTHTYDLANRLTSITGVDESVTAYSYDGNGLRASAASGEAIESFTWDLAAAYPLLLTDADLAYVYGTTGVPLAQIGLDAGAVDYLHTDTIGSVLTTTNTAGGVTAASDYDEYGLPQPAGAAAPVADVTRFGYAGEYTDPTGYLYLRARYHDPTTAQFLSVDPLLAVTGNPYGYTGGNPLQYADPLGLITLDDVGNWFAGFGDTVTFGGTREIRRLINYTVWGEDDDMVDNCSLFYEWGGYGGDVANVGLFVIGVGGITEALMGRITAAVRTMESAEAGTALVSTASSSALGAGEAAGAAADSGAPTLRSLAEQIRTAGRPGAAVNQRTIAVGEDAAGSLYAGSSGGFDAGQRAAADALGIIRVPSRTVGGQVLHAEENLVGAVPDLQRVGTSVRPPCGPLEHNCAAMLDELGVVVDG